LQVEAHHQGFTLNPGKGDVGRIGQARHLSTLDAHLRNLLPNAMLNALLQLLLALPFLAHVAHGKSTGLAQGDNAGHVLSAGTHAALLMSAVQQGVQRRSGAGIPPAYALGCVDFMSRE
jgi:hypothetical protein